LLNTFVAVKGYRYENLNTRPYAASQNSLYGLEQGINIIITNNGEVKQDINAATIPRRDTVPYFVAMIINCMPIKI
jgi:type IV secretory pathway VirB6-like protein